MRMGVDFRRRGHAYNGLHASLAQEYGEELSARWLQGSLARDLGQAVLHWRLTPHPAIYLQLTSAGAAVGCNLGEFQISFLSLLSSSLPRIPALPSLAKALGSPSWPPATQCSKADLATLPACRLSIFASKRHQSSLCTDQTKRSRHSRPSLGCWNGALINTLSRMHFLAQNPLLGPGALPQHLARNQSGHAT